MERVLITGASGFIGAALAERFHKNGYKVRAAFRRPEVPPHLVALGNSGAELVRMDLSSAPNLRVLVDSCNIVIHAAAKVSDFGRREEFEAANTNATARLLSAALEGGCRSLLYFSSISVHGFGQHLGSTESGPYYPLQSWYQRTKLLAEIAVQRANSPSFSTIIVRPGLVYGPGDTTTLWPTFELLDKGKLPMLAGFDHITCPIYITDLVDAVVAAIELPQPGGAVVNITSGEQLTLRDAIDYAASLLRRSVSETAIPMWAARAAAHISELASRVIGYRFRPPITPYLASQLSHDFHFSPAKAKDLLGFEAKVGWKEGIAASVSHFTKSHR